MSAAISFAISFTFTLWTDEGNTETEITVPGKMEVCPECEGTGYVLCEGMRGHCYTSEEFAEAFDDEEREEYFKRGGRYDVACPSCKGKNVVAVPDLDHCTAEQKAQLEVWEEQEADRVRMDEEDAHTRRMENGGWDY